MSEGNPRRCVLDHRVALGVVRYGRSVAARAARVLGVQRVVQLWAGLTRLAEDRRALEICLLGALI